VVSKFADGDIFSCCSFEIKIDMTHQNIFKGIIVLATYLLIIVLLILMTEVNAQQSLKRKIYQMKIINQDGSVVKGNLARIDDGNLFLSSDRGLLEVKTDQIRMIKVRRKGSVGKGIGIGAGTGALLGYIIGYSSYEEPDCTGTWFCIDYGPETEGMAGMTLGILLGGTVGGTIGSSSKKFEINGNQNSFDLIKPELSKYQLIYDPLADIDK